MTGLFIFAALTSRSLQTVKIVAPYEYIKKDNANTLNISVRYLFFYVTFVLTQK
jgi:hypothetical protein